jgi:hypothetical protein
MKPYGYVRKDGEGLFIYGEHQFQNAMGAELVPVYLHPKEWVGLTDEEFHKACWESYVDPVTGECSTGDREYAVHWTEAKLKEKNT